MFSICSRFSDEELSRAELNDEKREPNCGYLQSALAILSEGLRLSMSPELLNALAQNFHRSRPSTVQALLLLGYREFGTGTIIRLFLALERLNGIAGSMEQGWTFIGMLIDFDLYTLR